MQAGTRNVESTGGRPLPGSEAEPRVRVIELVPGQRVQATVVELGHGGEVTIGLLGGRVAALAKIALELGRAYEFTVTAVEPRVVLSAARPVALPAGLAASASGQLGAGAAELASLLRIATDVLAPSAERAPAAASDAADPRRMLAAFEHGVPSPEALREFGRMLGHDQEARVLRLAGLSERAAASERAELRSTLKAEALQIVDRATDTQAGEQRVRAARELVDGLSRIESDNARRAEHGTPAWLPLPALPGSPLRDARMFVRWHDAGSEDGSHAGSTERPFTIVLLLDLTRLGQMRVDVALSGREIAIDFEVVELGASLAVRAALESLGGELGRSGF